MPVPAPVTAPVAAAPPVAPVAASPAAPGPTWSTVASQAAAMPATPAAQRAPAIAPPFQPAPIPGAGVVFGPVEIIALAGIGVGWLLPGPGWLAGVVAVLISPRWSAGEKALVIIGPIVLVVLPFVGFMSTVFDPGFDGISTSIGWLLVMMLAAVISWPGAAIYLWVKARRHRRGVGAPAA